MQNKLLPQLGSFLHSAFIKFYFSNSLQRKIRNVTYSPFFNWYLQGKDKEIHRNYCKFSKLCLIPRSASFKIPALLSYSGQNPNNIIFFLQTLRFICTEIHVINFLILQTFGAICKHRQGHHQQIALSFRALKTLTYFGYCP